MQSNISPISVEKIRAGFVNKDLQNLPIYYYDVTDSTNERAKEYAKSSSSDAIFIAEKQTAGRGRMGRRFESDESVGIYVSFLTHPTIRPDEAATLTVKAAVALSRAIEEVAGFTPSIKWVNDLEFSGKKLAGILAEGKAVDDSHLSYAITGIGVNVYKRQFSSEISDIATTIEDASGKRVEREAIISRLTEELFRDEDYSDIISYYREHCSTIGCNITVKRIDSSFPARAIDVNEKGELLIEKENGEREYLYSGELSVRRS